MASIIAKKVAGTYLPDSIGEPPPVHRWALLQCRRGLLAPWVKSFCAAQPEMLEASLVQIESVTPERIQCRIPCRLYDHECDHPYSSEVRFALNPITGEAKRLD